MNVRSFYLATSFLLGIYFLIGNAGGVPQAVTKAPGESNHNSCATCHSPGNFNASIKLDVMKTDSSVIKSYTPGETYIVRVKVSGTNNPKAYGFQMSCLDSLTNTDMGAWSDLGTRVKTQNFTVQQKQRKYLVQSAAKTDGIFTAKWKAPATNLGTIKFYFTGLAINQNGRDDGDNNAFSQLSINGPSSSSSNELATDDFILFPNPANDIIKFRSEDIQKISFISLTGNVLPFIIENQKEINVQALSKGAYIAVLYDKNGQKLSVQRFTKL